MRLSITSIELKGPLKFFGLSSRAMQIVRQLKSTDCVQYKSRGFWTTHYTMSLWNSEQELKEFSRSGAHAEAMKASMDLARELRFLTIDADEMPTWKEAKKMLLDNGKVIRR